MNSNTTRAILTIASSVSLSMAQPIALNNEHAREDQTPRDTPQSIAALLTYDASLGTLPAEQGWDVFGPLNDDDIVTDGVFHLIASGALIGSQSNAAEFDWSSGISLSMTARVPVGIVAVTFLGPGYRGGINLYGKDSFGQIYTVLVGANNFVFSSDTNINPHPTRTVEKAFDSATEFHTYSIDSNAIGATLYIDGVAQAYVPIGNTSSGSPVTQWYIDSRAFPVQSQWTQVSLGNDSSCTADLNGDGELNFFDVSEFIQAFTAGCP